MYNVVWNRATTTRIKAYNARCHGIANPSKVATISQRPLLPVSTQRTQRKPPRFARPTTAGDLPPACSVSSPSRSPIRVLPSSVSPPLSSEGAVFPSALINDSEARLDGSYPKNSTNFARNSGRYPHKVLALTPNCCAASSHEVGAGGQSLCLPLQVLQPLRVAPFRERTLRCVGHRRFPPQTKFYARGGNSCWLRGKLGLKSHSAGCARAL